MSFVNHPEANRLPERTLSLRSAPPTVRWLLGLALLAFAAHVAQAAFGVFGDGAAQFFNAWVYDVLMLAAAGLCLVRAARIKAQRATWLATTHHDARTDALTGLGNRRALLSDLDQVLGNGAEPKQRVLAIFDLNGFKTYNDTFGHPAGDALLARLGRALGERTSRFGRAYRLGGDEFCLLADLADREAGRVAADAAEALIERGEGFVIGACFGEVIIPDEAAEPSEAMRLADQRLCVQKAYGRPSAGAQVRDVLLSVLRERTPALHQHLSGVAELAERVATRLGVENERLEEVVSAGQLHDVGKTAIPDEILNKPGPLTDEERGFIHRHPLIAHRILGAAPALRGIAGIVRSCSERWDGSGYPDGLAAEDIPLSARIVAVCDAYDAMTSDRPYRPALRPDEAMAELRREAGTSWDPHVVEACCAEIRESCRRPARLVAEPGD